MQSKYLIFDIVALEGRKLKEGETIQEGDLEIESDSYDRENSPTILKDGVNIINNLNTLVNEYNYSIVFCSYDSQRYQLEALKRFNEACEQKNLTFPEVSATTLGKRQKSSQTTSASSEKPPKIDSIEVAYFPVTSSKPAKDDPEKIGPRKALSNVLGIQPNQEHIVFDTQQVVANKAKVEGYQAYHITGNVTQKEAGISSSLSSIFHGKAQSLSLNEAINRILTQEQAEKVEEETILGKESSPSAALPDDLATIN